MGKTAILSVRIISDAKKAVDGFNQAEQSVGGFKGKLSSVMGKAGPIVAAGAGAIAAGIGMAGKALYDMGAEFDEVADTIRVGTGATGDALQGLIDDAHAVATSVPTDFATAGSTVADLNTRLGLSGDTLQTVASQYLEAGRILGEEVDIASTTAAFSAFGIEGERVEGAMDSLFQVSQATGVSMNDLAGSAQKNAGAMTELGFSFDDTIALVGSLDKAGIDADGTLTAMRKGLMNVAKPGQDLGDAFYETTDKIGQFVKAGDDAAALDLAGKVFGTKGAAQMVQAIKDGTLAVDDLKAHTGATSDTILGVGKDTQDAAEKWQILKNKGKEALEPLASGLFDLAGNALGAVTDAIDNVDWGKLSDVSGLDNLIQGFKDAANWAKSLDLSGLIQGFKDATGSAQPLTSTLSDLWQKASDLAAQMRETLGPVIEDLAPIIGRILGQAFERVVAVIDTVIGVMSGLTEAFGGVVDVIKGIASGDWTQVWDGIKQIASGSADALKSLLKGAWDFIAAGFGDLPGRLSTALSNLPGTLSRAFSSAWDRARSATSSGIQRAVSLVRGLPGQAASALGGIGSTLWNAGRSLINGLINGIKSMFGSVKSTLADLTAKLTSWKGPEDLDRRLLTPAGQMIIGSLITGLEDRYGDVRASLGRLTSMIGSTDLGTLHAPWTALPAYRTGTGQGAAPVTINVTVNGALNSEDTARQIERVLRDHTRRHYGVAA